MKIILATGIYPPDIGGPATYVSHLAATLWGNGEDVTVITYAKRHVPVEKSPWKVTTVSKWGGPLLRWWRFSQKLRAEGANADIVYAFSPMSVGMPLFLARLKKPKKILRFGGDFLWERYTDWHGRKSLHQWYASFPRLSVLLGFLFRRFDVLVFSTRFQAQLYHRFYGRLPKHVVIENALPEGESVLHTHHEPFRLLFMGRFVRFKNLRSLLFAVADLPHVTLTLMGEGPVARELSALSEKLHLKGRLVFLPPTRGAEKEKVLREHDLLIIPSITEISPHVALEARAIGLPVLLTVETGLSEGLHAGMFLSPLKTVEDITRAILDAEHRYEEVAAEAASPFQKRGWEAIAEETNVLFRSLL